MRFRFIPSKRDLEDMKEEGKQHGVSFDGEDELKRAKRENGGIVEKEEVDD